MAMNPFNPYDDYNRGMGLSQNMSMQEYQRQVMEQMKAEAMQKALAMQGMPQKSAPPPAPKPQPQMNKKLLLTRKA